MNPHTKIKMISCTGYFVTNHKFFIKIASTSPPAIPNNVEFIVNDPNS